MPVRKYQGRLTTPMIDSGRSRSKSRWKTSFLQHSRTHNGQDEATEAMSRCPSPTIILRLQFLRQSSTMSTRAMDEDIVLPSAEVAV